MDGRVPAVRGERRDDEAGRGGQQSGEDCEWRDETRPTRGHRASLGGIVTAPDLGPFGPFSICSECLLFIALVPNLGPRADERSARGGRHAARGRAAWRVRRPWRTWPARCRG